MHLVTSASCTWTYPIECALGLLTCFQLAHGKIDEMSLLRLGDKNILAFMFLTLVSLSPICPNGSQWLCVSFPVTELWKVSGQQPTGTPYLQNEWTWKQVSFLSNFEMTVARADTLSVLVTCSGLFKRSRK